MSDLRYVHRDGRPAGLHFSQLRISLRRAGECPKRQGRSQRCGRAREEWSDGGIHLVQIDLIRRISIERRPIRHRVRRGRRTWRVHGRSPEGHARGNAWVIRHDEVAPDLAECESEVRSDIWWCGTEVYGGKGV